MTDFLLELRSEEIPARMQLKAKDDLARLFTDAMAKAGLAAASIEALATPRRLALIAKGLPLETAASSEETKGPKVGAPPQAMEGFLRKTGLTQDQLIERDGVYFAIAEKPGRKTADVLAEAIPAIIRAFPWPKSQRWGAASVSTESLRWVRPLQGIIALLGDDVVDCEIDGIVSRRTTMGHRFHSSGPIEIANADGYVEALRAAHVIVHFSERTAIIRDGAETAAKAAGLVLVPDESLVTENAGLTEWPVPMLGRFDPAFLAVPQEVIQLTARVNQKYFVCNDADGKLANAFVCTANIKAHDGGAAIVAGNEKVLAARLSDAKFFWEQDLKVALDVQAEKLSQITFHEKLGTVADKVERVAKLARWLVEEGIIKPSPLQGRGLGEGAVNSSAALSDSPPTPALPPEGERELLANQAERAARLCKADLVTGMVGEFPELQGIMGGYYARAQGEPDAVADAVRDHYKPVGQGDDVPTAPVTVAVSLADKLDTLVGFFAINERPTGSKDPFALRRAAIGCVETIATYGIRCSLRDVVREAYRLIVVQTASSHPTVSRDLLNENHLSPLLAENSCYAEDMDLSVLSAEPLLIDFNETGQPVWNTENLRDSGLVRYDVCSLTDTVGSVTEYFFDRVRERQKRSGRRADIISAVLPRSFIDLGQIGDFELGKVRSPNWTVDDDVVRQLNAGQALETFVATQEGADLLAGYKRAANILRQSPSPLAGEGRGEGTDASASQTDISAADAAGDPTPNPLPQGERALEEVALLNALNTAEPLAAAAIEAEKFEHAMAALASLRAPIDAFFEGVMVNDPDPEKRAFRVGLLTRFRNAVHRVADFSRIEG